MERKRWDVGHMLPWCCTSSLDCQGLTVLFFKGNFTNYSISVHEVPLVATATTSASTDTDTDRMDTSLATHRLGKTNQKDPPPNRKSPHMNTIQS